MNQNEIKSTFSETLKKILEDRNMTQTALSVKADVSQQNISKYINGISLPDLGTVAQIADALDVSVDHLLGRDAIDRSHEIRSAPLSYYLRDLVTIADTLNLKVCSNGCFIDPHAPEVSDLEMLEYEIDCRTHSALVDFFDSWARFRGLLEKGDFLFDDYSVLVNNKLAGYADIINERDIFIKKDTKK